MKYITKIKFVIWFVAVVAIIPVALYATILQYVPLEQMVKESNAVVLAKVTHKETRTINKVVYTFSHLQILETIKGEVADSSEIVVRQRGGTKDGLVVHTLGDAMLQDGKRYVLFLIRDGDSWILDAMAQAAYTVFEKNGKQMVRNDLNLTRIDTKTGKSITGPILEKPIELDEFIARIRKIASTNGKAK